ncbi:MAG TPA: SGNH/GDSL hydrolase family protein [Vicinamibacterales bacterium]|nr:SGNH/GDSL hydrolase family protein [Vicinamibacterales bacterium]
MVRRHVSAARVARGWLLLAAIAMTPACGSSPTTPPPPVVLPPVVEPPAEPPPPPPPPPAPPTLAVSRILAFGDSMTEGVDSPPLTLTPPDWRLPLNPGRSRSYPFKLHAVLTARYTAQTIAVFNGGISGNEARADRGRFSQAMSEGKPNLILLMEGANDLSGPLAVGEGINARVTSVVDALEDMIRDASGRGIPVMIATLPPQRPNSPKGGGVAFLPRFHSELKAMAAKKGAQVVDVNAQMPLSLIGQDGLHPTEAGYQKIAEIWFEAIKARYERAPQ